MRRQWKLSLLPRRNWQQYFTLPAQLVPFEAVDIYPKVTGFMDMDRVDRALAYTRANSLSGYPPRNSWPSARRQNPPCARLNRNDRRQASSPQTRALPA